MNTSKYKIHHQRGKSDTNFFEIKQNLDSANIGLQKLRVSIFSDLKNSIKTSRKSSFLNLENNSPSNRKNVHYQTVIDKSEMKIISPSEKSSNSDCYSPSYRKNIHSKTVINKEMKISDIEKEKSHNQEEESEFFILVFEKVLLFKREFDRRVFVDQIINLKFYCDNILSLIQVNIADLKNELLKECPMIVENKIISLLNKLIEVIASFIETKPQFLYREVKDAIIDRWVNIKREILNILKDIEDSKNVLNCFSDHNSKDIVDSYLLSKKQYIENFLIIITKSILFNISRVCYETDYYSLMISSLVLKVFYAIMSFINDDKNMPESALTPKDKIKQYKILHLIEHILNLTRMFYKDTQTNKISLESGGLNSLSKFILNNINALISKCQNFQIFEPFNNKLKKGLFQKSVNYKFYKHYLYKIEYKEYNDDSEIVKLFRYYYNSKLFLWKSILIQLDDSKKKEESCRICEQKIPISEFILHVHYCGCQKIYYDKIHEYKKNMKKHIKSLECYRAKLSQGFTNLSKNLFQNLHYMNKMRLENILKTAIDFNNESDIYLNLLIIIYTCEHKKPIDYYENNPDQLKYIISMSYLSLIFYISNKLSSNYDEELSKAFGSLFSLLLQKMTSVHFLLYNQKAKTKSNILKMRNHQRHLTTTSKKLLTTKPIIIDEKHSGMNKMDSLKMIYNHPKHSINKQSFEKIENAISLFTRKSSNEFEEYDSGSPKFGNKLKSYEQKLNIKNTLFKSKQNRTNADLLKIPSNDENSIFEKKPHQSMSVKNLTTILNENNNNNNNNNINNTSFTNLNLSYENINFVKKKSNYEANLIEHSPKLHARKLHNSFLGCSQSPIRPVKDTTHNHIFPENNNNNRPTFTQLANLRTSNMRNTQSNNSLSNDSFSSESSSLNVSNLPSFEEKFIHINSIENIEKTAPKKSTKLSLFNSRLNKKVTLNEENNSSDNKTKDGNNSGKKSKEENNSSDKKSKDENNSSDKKSKDENNSSDKKSKDENESSENNINFIDEEDDLSIDMEDDNLIHSSIDFQEGELDNSKERTISDNDDIIIFEEEDEQNNPIIDLANNLLGLYPDAQKILSDYTITDILDELLLFVEEDENYKKKKNNVNFINNNNLIEKNNHLITNISNNNIPDHIDNANLSPDLSNNNNYNLNCNLNNKNKNNNNNTKAKSESKSLMSLSEKNSDEVNNESVNRSPNKKPTKTKRKFSSFSVSKGHSKISISSFKLILNIAKGGYGAVALYQKKTTGDYYAIKSVDITQMKEKKLSSTLKQEQKILKEINSDYLVNSYFIFKDEKYFYFAMEYLPCGDVYTLISSIIIPEKIIQLIIAETILGIHYLHNLHIIHHDIKPANILITNYGHFKLSDFGLSKTVQTDNNVDKYVKNFQDFITDINEDSSESDTDENNNNQAVGTLDYMAPELFTDEFPESGAIDYWAVGVVLYELYSFKVPFEGDSQDKIKDNIVNMNINWEYLETDDIKKKYKNVNNGIDLIKKFLVKNPYERWGDKNLEDIKTHPFFKGFNWKEINKIRNKSLLDHLKKIANEINKKIKEANMHNKEKNNDDLNIQIEDEKFEDGDLMEDNNDDEENFTERIDNLNKRNNDVIKMKLKKNEFCFKDNKDLLLLDLK